jgi:predicted restriction endonuclease
LLKAYGGKCAVTGCNAAWALEAAHLIPYSGPSTSDVSNGLLLRSDIHTLFDLDLLGVDPNSLTIVVAPALIGTPYNDLMGCRLNISKEKRMQPDHRALCQRWKHFCGKRPAR